MVLSSTCTIFAPHTNDNKIMSETEVYAVKKDHSDTWIQQSWIDGFEYENGYEYKIKVRETSYLDYNRSEPAWTEYKMTELISKEKKASEGIPDNFIPKWYKPQE